MPNHTDESFRDYTEQDFRDYSQSEPARALLLPVFSFPACWPWDDLCRFHELRLSSRILRSNPCFFRLETSWCCPDCGLMVRWARQGEAGRAYKFSATTTREFLATIDMFVQAAEGQR